MSVSIPLYVPYQAKNEAKSLGARWDPMCRTWWAPAGADLAAFEPWLPEWCWPTPADVPTASAEVVTIGTRCWRCDSVVPVVVGALAAHPDGPRHFVEFDDLAPFLVTQIPPRVLASAGIGAIRWRRSRMVPEGYLANGCVRCDAIQGSYPLFEELHAYRAEGGALERLPVVAKIDVPVGLLDYSEWL